MPRTRHGQTTSFGDLAHVPSSSCCSEVQLMNLERKHFIKKQSKRRRQASQVRRTMLKEFYTNVCAGAELVPKIACRGALDPHEPLTRARGGSIVDPENLLWLCRSHHDWTHDHPVQAHEVGLLKHSWERA